MKLLGMKPFILKHPKNYYQLMQIADLMNQVFELSSLLADVRRIKERLAFCQHVTDG